jgi:hypothetical protein
MAYLRSKKLPQRMRLARGEDDTAGGGLLAAAEGLLGCRPEKRNQGSSGEEIGRL